MKSLFFSLALLFIGTSFAQKDAAVMKMDGE
jgi:hypothetical protein